jgi:hypothetical protein
MTNEKPMTHNEAKAALEKNLMAELTLKYIRNILKEEFFNDGLDVALKAHPDSIQKILSGDKIARADALIMLSAEVFKSISERLFAAMKD